MRTPKPLLFKDALIYDGSGNAATRGDLLVQHGKVLQIGAVPEPPQDAVLIPMEGKCISPGWIDLHTHVFAGQGIFSVEAADIGLHCGVTTLVDAGSAGALTFGSFAREAREAREEVLAYVNVASGGLLHGHAGEPGFVGDHFHTRLHAECFAESLLTLYPEQIVGWKVRLTAALADMDPHREVSALEALIALRDRTGLPVMIHHILSSISAQEVLSKMKKYDVYTHFYHGKENGVFPAGAAHPMREVLEARERGVLFDVGHGSGGFSWEVAARACQEFGFWPDVISSDLHRYNLFAPVRDLATTMSKFLHLGASREQVIAMVTLNARRALTRGDVEASRLAPGYAARLTIFELEHGSFPLTDSEGKIELAHQRIIPLAVMTHGAVVPCYGYFAHRASSDAFATATTHIMSLNLPEFSLKADGPAWELKPIAAATLPVPGWECVFGKNDCTMQEITFWIWVLRQGETIAIIDTGVPSGPELLALNRANQQIDAASVFTVHRSLDEILAEEGIAPENVRYVLLSQLITYATGGLRQSSLPNATIYCSWGGMHELLTRKPGHPPRDFYLTPESWAYCRELLVEDRLIFAEAALEIAPGLVYEPTGGHHPGSAGVRVKTVCGVVGILETAFVQENIDREMPIGVAENANECREVIRQYRKSCDLAIAGHAPDALRLLADFFSRAQRIPKNDDDK